MTSMTNSELVEELAKALFEASPFDDDKPEDYFSEAYAILPIIQAREAAAADRIEALEARCERYREALAPSGDTKAAYIGEFAFTLTRIDECGDEYPEKVYVPWTTIKDIMAAIRKRTALEEAGNGRS